MRSGAARAMVPLIGAIALACGAEDRPPAVPAADATPPAAAAPSEAPAPAVGLGWLRDLVGKYPRDVGLFDREPLRTRLVTLLGGRHSAFLANMGTQGPILANGDVIYVIGNKPHAGGDSAAILLVDLDQDLIHVRILDETEMAELRERDLEIVLPADVATTIANWEELARDAE